METKRIRLKYPVTRKINFGIVPSLRGHSFWLKVKSNYVKKRGLLRFKITGGSHPKAA